MNFGPVLRDDDAQSEVIGVILMVAIVVILAAVVGTFVLGVADQAQTTPPQTTFAFEFDDTDTGTSDCGTALGSDGALTITHETGESVKAAALSVTDGSSTYDVDTCTAVPSDVASGTSWTEQVDSDDTVRVTWESDGGGAAATLVKWTGPDA